MSIKEKYSHLPPLPADIGERLGRITEVLRQHPIRLAYLFGSAAHDPSQSTDIDIAVLPDEGFSFTALYADLSLALNTDRLDLVDLRFAPSYLQVEILAAGKCLLAPSEAGRLRFESGKLMQWREARRRWLSTLQEEQEMKLKREFIAKALAELERVAQELEKYRGTTAEAMAADLSLRWIVERGLLTGLTLLFQVADHILTHAFQRTVETYEGLIAELRAVGVISEELYKGLRGAGGFRNVLVHEYLEIDLREVAANLQEAPKVFRCFQREILEWLSRLPEELK